MNETIDILRAELMSLARQLDRHNIDIIVGGGYGLLLRQEHVMHSGARTVRAIPDARSTNDLDIFLSVEIVTNGHNMTALRTTLHESGYTAIEGAKYYQFQKSVSYQGTPRSVKLDLLAPPPRDPALRESVKIKERRIRHRDVEEIHARTTPEAFSVEERVMQVELGGTPVVRVLIPHPYSFMLLKLFAYRDRKEDPAKGLGLYHAFDLYRIVAMMTEEEYAGAEQLRDQLRGDEIVVEAQGIVNQLFHDLDSPGALAILEHSGIAQVGISEADLEAFLEDLWTFFPRQAEG